MKIFPPGVCGPFPARALASVASAGLLVGSLSFPGWGNLAWIALVPFLRALHGQPLRARALCSVIFGWSFFCGLLYWIGLVTVPGLIILITYLTLYPLAFGCLVRRINRRRDLIFIPALWTALELARSHALTGFGWGLLGYSQAENILIVQLADRAGVWGLSAFVVVINTAIAQALLRTIPRPRRLAAIATALSLLALSAGYGAWRLRQTYPAPPLKISLIQPNIAQDLKWDAGKRSHIMLQLQTLTLQAAQEHPDLIVWPETSVPGYLLDDPLLAVWVSRLAKQAGTHVLVGSPRADHRTEKYYNSAFLFDAAGELVSYYDKIHLVPFGEYLPLPRLLWFLQAIPIADFSAGIDYTLLPVTSAAGKTVDCAVIICFEDIFPGLVRRFRRAGADIYINITNEAWFGRSTEPFQHLTKSIVRAVENRRWFIRCANTGISGVIDPHGRVRRRVLDGRADIFVAGTLTEDIAASAAPGGQKK